MWSCLRGVGWYETETSAIFYVERALNGEYNGIFGYIPSDFCPALYLYRVLPIVLEDLQSGMLISAFFAKKLRC